MNYPKIYNNDIKVLGRVVAITSENKVAAAEQIFDEDFKYSDSQKYNIDPNKTGLEQYEINRLFKDRIYPMEQAGLVPNSDGILDIVIPVNFREAVTMTNLNVSGMTKTTNLKVINNAEIENATMKNLTSDYVTINHNLNVDGDTNINGALEIHKNAKFYKNVTVQGDTVLNNLTVNLNFDAPEATTAKAGVVKLAENLSDNDDNDVVPVSLLRSFYQLILDNPNTQTIDSIRELIDYINSTGQQIPTNLNDMNDVNISTPQNGDILYYNGSKWINTSLSAILNNLKQEIINQLSGDIAGACLWKVQDGRLVPTTSGIDVATSGRFYSGSSSSNNNFLNGDFNGDGVINGLDILAFTNAMNAGTTDPRFDINGDGEIDGRDIQAFTNIVNQQATSNP